MCLGRIVRLMTAGLCALTLAACLDEGGMDGLDRQPENLFPSAPAAPPPDKVFKEAPFAWTGDIESAPLPKWKTNWELEIERLSKNAQAEGIPYADKYSDYRNKNITKYFVTKAPTSKFRKPAEYEQQQAYMLNWYSSTYYQKATWQKFFTDIIKGAWGVVPVLMLYKDTAHRTYLETQLKALGYSAADLLDKTKIIWWQETTDAIWARDFGPLGIVSTPTTGKGKLSIVDFRYYHARMYDDRVPTDLADEWGINVFRPDLDYEGGNFMNTSDGLCASTKGVLWYNLQFSQSSIEQIYKDYLACKKFIWPTPMAGGVIAHIDMFAKFGSDTTMVVGKYTKTQHAQNKTILDANAKLFETTKTPTNKTITVTRIPMPNIGTSGSTKIWRTYTNALAVVGATKKVLLVPTYSDETSNEKAAAAAFTKAFPGFTLVQVDSKVIIPGQGAVHCITMEIPVGERSKMETDPGALCGASKYICVAASCGNITSKGCCSGELLKYCQGNKLYAQDCLTNPKCGWSKSKSWYDCGTPGGSDPTKAYVKNCDVLTDAPLPDLGPDMASCGSVTAIGCCEGNKVKFCKSGKLFTLDCKNNPSCGWNPTQNSYFCGTAGTPDPTCKNPMPCPTAGDAGNSEAGAADACVPLKPDLGQLDQEIPDQSQPDVFTADTVPTPDQGSKKDLAVKDGGGDAGGGDPEDEGCDCNLGSSPRPAHGSLMLLLLGGVLLIRRRLQAG